PERERAWWRDLVAEVFAPFAPIADFEAFFETLYGTFDSARGWRLFPETTEALERLTVLGYPLGIISNFDSRLLTVCETLGIRRFFASITFSSAVGAAKPDPAIFRHAVAEHGVTPGEALHVGDNPEGDIEGALAAGLRAVLVDRRGRHAASQVPTIRSLLELIPAALGG
ncbi:MAG: HAD-IA family hydrolase, partial [Nitrospirae bacterium]|nr:HAD-IA family hydrolase [Nitrospirota bacterium]